MVHLWLYSPCLGYTLGESDTQCDSGIEYLTLGPNTTNPRHNCYKNFLNTGSNNRGNKINLERYSIRDVLENHRNFGIRKKKITLWA